MQTYALATGDVLEVLRDLPSDTFDGLLCDPPYGFSFMGKVWDYDVPRVEVWAECLRVLKPGAPLLAFGGARTYHRLACGIEDAGFELRDCLMWLYGKGFPKSQNVGLAIDKAAGAVRPVTGSRTLTGNAAVSTADKGGTYGVQVGGTGAKKTIETTGPATELAREWDGYGTALKPAYEPVCLARKPLAGTMAENVAAHGVGGLNINGARVGGQVFTQEEWDQKGASRPTGAAFGVHKPSCNPVPEGRWPANLLLDEEAGAALDATVAPSKSTPYPDHAAQGAVLALERRTAGGYADAGGPSRFFYCAKVSTKEREHGCGELPIRSAGEVTDREDGTAGLESSHAGAGRTGGARNHHPTLKPLALTEYLARLILPPTRGACLLVPFAGSGSEVIGALRARWPSVFGIEREPDYVTIANARIPAHAPPGLTRIE